MKNVLFWTLFLILPGIFFAVLYWLDRPPTLDPRFLISEAEVVVSNNQTPPSVDVDWETVSLPYVVEDELGPFPSVWFRVFFKPQDYQLAITGMEQSGLLFRAPYANLAIYLNGYLVGQQGRMTPPVSYFRRSMLFPLSSALIDEQRNEILIHMVKPRPGGLFHGFYLAPEARVLPVFANDLFLKLRLPQAIMVAMGFVATIMGVLFLLRQRETAYGWYALTLLFWMLHHSHDLVVDIPIKNYWLWVTLSYVSLGWFVTFSTFFVNRFLGYQPKRVERGVIVLALLGSLVLFALAYFNGYQSVAFAQAVWVPAINLLGIYIVVQLFRGVRMNPSLEKKGLLLVAYLVSIVGIRDYFFELNTPWVPGTAYYLQYSSGFVLVFFSLILMRRFAFALAEAESLNEDLERRIEQKVEELEVNFQKLQQVEHERTLVEERERIMRDMHDGFGGQLVQVLSQVENTPALASVESTIRDALQDLRLIIDSLFETDGNLLTVLAAFRHRVSRPVENCGMQLRWQVTDLPHMKNLGPSTTLQVLRISQEAVSNVIKHAEDTEICISTLVADDGRINICVADNGQGYTPANIGEVGHGLINMRHRADRIGALLAIDSGSHGTRVELSLLNSQHI